MLSYVVVNTYIIPIYFFGFTFEESQLQILKKLPLDSIVFDYMLSTFREYESGIIRKTIRVIRQKLGFANIFDYKKYSDLVQKQLLIDEKIHPCIIPNYDHSPRSGNKNIIIHNSFPKHFGTLCSKIISRLKNRSKEENLLFIKAWNEWGEGNYMEPDLKFGHGYIEALKKAIEDNK